MVSGVRVSVVSGVGVRGERQSQGSGVRGQCQGLVVSGVGLGCRIRVRGQG